MPYRAFIAKFTGEKNVYLKYAPEFYSTFPYDNQIEIELPVKVLARNTFLHLMKDIVSSANRNIMIVAHGSEKHGLFLDTGSRKNIVTYQIMFLMMLYRELKRKFSEPGTTKNPEKLVEVIRLVRDYRTSTTEETREEMLALDNPPPHPVYDNEKIRVARYKRMPEETEEEKKIKEKTAKGMIKTYVKYIKDETRSIEKIFKTRRLLINHVKQISEIQKLQINNIAIRGCNIGKDRSLLEIYRRFFNARSINAPKVKINYGKAVINLRGRQKTLNSVMKRAAIKYLGNKVNPSNWMGGSSTSLQGPKDPGRISGIYYHPPALQSGKDELLITVRSLKSNPACYIVAEHIDVALDFAGRKFGRFAPGRHDTFRRNKKTKRFEMPICCLEQYPLTFPQDQGFAQSLENVSGSVK